ncbi:hypothetical protein ACLB2K_026558 [Fragaria x ananassa]
MSKSSEGTSSNPQTTFQGHMTARRASLLETAPEVPVSSRQAAVPRSPRPLTEVSAPRMPEIHRAPTPGPTSSDSGSSGVQMPPPHLFLPRMIPAIPVVDDSGTPIYPLPPAPLLLFLFLLLLLLLLLHTTTTNKPNTRHIVSPPPLPPLPPPSPPPPPPLSLLTTPSTLHPHAPNGHLPRPPLRLLNLSNNVFNRTFPPELSNLTNLRVLDLYNNNLTGVLPVSVAHMTNLRHLHLGGSHDQPPPKNVSAVFFFKTQKLYPTIFKHNIRRL